MLSICTEAGIPAAARRLPLAELHIADELFATSAVRGVVPITRLDGALRAAGPITARIAAAYLDRLRAT